MKVRVVVVDDEPVARAGLKRMLAGIAWLTVAGEAGDGPTAVAAIDQLKPDLVLLDIQMPGLSGTDVLRRITHQPHVIFTTAHAHHAVTAFELGALDYVLKPFGEARLLAALERARAALGEPASEAPLDRLAEALAKGPIARLFVRAGGAIVPVAVAEVRWFEARGDYVRAHTAAGRHVLHVSLNRLEERLDPARFVRIHRAHIVNLDHVASFGREGKDRLEAVLKDGTRLAVSRGRAPDLRRLAL